MNPRKLPITLGLITLITMGLVYSCIKKEMPIPPPITYMVNLRSGLLLYLPFNGSMADSSGNNNPTAIGGGASLGTDEHGSANSAFSSDGTGQVLVVTNNGSIKFDTAYSLSFNSMVNYAHQQMYISMVDTSTGYGPSWNIGTSLPGLYALDAGFGDSTAGCGNFGGSDPNRIVDTTAFQPQAGVWYNYTVIYHKGVVQIYVNGKLVSTKTGTGSKALLCPSSEIFVGGWWSGDLENINGKIDEVRLYDRVLTPQEITQLAINL